MCWGSGADVQCFVSIFQQTKGPCEMTGAFLETEAYNDFLFSGVTACPKTTQA